MRVGGQLHNTTALPPGMTRYPLYRRLGGPQDRSGRVRKISPPPGLDPRTVQPVASRYTDWAIAAHIKFLKYSQFHSTLYNQYSGHNVVTYLMLAQRTGFMILLSPCPDRKSISSLFLPPRTADVCNHDASRRVQVYTCWWRCRLRACIFNVF
jgi:hypothetical protein